MSFWTLVFAFSLALTLDQVTRFLLRRLATFVANRAWERAVAKDKRPAPVEVLTCYLCGEYALCDHARPCPPDVHHAHRDCMEDYEIRPTPETPHHECGRCVGTAPDA